MLCLVCQQQERGTLLSQLPRRSRPAIALRHSTASKISEHLAERGLELNDKTQIFPLRNGLDFLGFHSYLTDTGKVVRKLRRASRERMKRKLRKYKVMYESGAITKEKITESYQSWRSHASHGDCHALIQKYDQLYNEIFERSETADVSIN